MNVLFLSADIPEEWNTSRWRCELPSIAIGYVPGWEGRMAPLRGLVEEAPEVIALAEWADILIMERLLIGEALVAIEIWKAKGKIVLGTIDDAYHYMPSSVVSFDFWHTGRVTREENGKQVETKLTYKPIQQLEWGIKLLDGVLCASEELVNDWSQYTTRTYLFPNYMRADLYYQYRRTVCPDAGHIIIGWGGSHSHLDSWKNSGLPEALRKIATRFPNVQVVLAGGDFRIYNLIRIPPERIRIAKWVHPNIWPRILAEFSIGVIPLAGWYDERRSLIKPQEYLVMGIPWIGSNNKALHSVGDMGILVNNTQNAWERALSHVIENYSDYFATAQQRADQFSRVDIESQGIRLVKILDQIAQSYPRRKRL